MITALTVVAVAQDQLPKPVESRVTTTTMIAVAQDQSTAPDKSTIVSAKVMQLSTLCGLHSFIGLN